MANISCRIFKEQIELLKGLPDQEEAKTILYAAVMYAYNQFENQNENQIDNQFDNQNANQNHLYLYLCNNNISSLGLNIYNLFIKNITFKRFSNNYGGSRVNSGRHKSTTIPQKSSTYSKGNVDEEEYYHIEW